MLKNKFPLIRFLFGSRASTNDGIPIVKTLVNVIWMGINGVLKNKNNIASKVEYIVFTKNNDAERWILFIERRPSRTTFGIDEKSEFNSTNCETFLAASLPFAITTLQSASFSAKTSFTPSPVIATVCPCSFSAQIISFFCIGETLPKIEQFFTAFWISSFVFKVFASTHLS